VLEKRQKNLGIKRYTVILVEWGANEGSYELSDDKGEL
jgi:hypothetical protein